MNRRYIIITILGLTGLSLLIYFFIAQAGHQNRQAQLVHSRWISAHTSGTISAHSAVKIYFSKKMIDKGQSGMAVSDQVFNIKPSVEGQAIWVQPNILEFTPAQPFQNGETYNAEVDLAAIIDSLETDSYKFDFNIIKQNFQIDIEEIMPVSTNNSSLLKACGKVTLADKAKKQIVSKLIQASIREQAYAITWKSDKSNLHYNFVIDSIPRREQPTQLVLNYNGKPLNIKKKGTTSYKIPSKNEFILTGHKIQQHPDQQIILFFSDPVKRSQEIKGLVQFQKIKDYQIDIIENKIYIQPLNRQNIIDNLTIQKSIKSTNGKTLEADTLIKTRFEKLQPAVRGQTDKVILPPGEQGALFAFEAVNLKAVDVRIFKVFEKNVIQFLQVNSLKEHRQLRRVGKPVFQQTIVLDQYPNTDLGQWNTYHIDLNKIVAQSPGALYHVQVSFRKENAITKCNEKQKNKKAVIAPSSFWNRFDHYSYAKNYSWQNRKDPCHEAYYGYRKALRHNFMVSDIGLIAKKGQNDQVTVFTTSISETKKMDDIQVQILDYQQQILQKGYTDESGTITFTELKAPYFIKASDGQHTSYLRLNQSETLAYSHFPTDGLNVNDGLKGFLYNERGVYRPGDTIHAGFMLYDLTGKLPSKTPVTIELYNARSQQVARKVISRSASDHYLVHFPTQTDDETGTWQVRAFVGNQVFNKQFHVETIKPNRLKINIDAHQTVKADQKSTLDIHAEWLHGATVSNLKVTGEVKAQKNKLKFDQWTGYQFNHIEQQFKTTEKMFFKGKLNATGKANIPAYIPENKQLPAKIHLSYLFKVFEPNGNFSIASHTQNYLPYNNYVGFRLPEPTGKHKMYKTNQTIKTEIVTVDSEGNKRQKPKRVKVNLYKVMWSWWWESNAEFGYQYRKYKELKQSKYLSLKNGKGTFNLSVDRNNWGRYLLEVTNLSNQQKASRFIYFDWPSGSNQANRPEGLSQNMLRFTTNKKSYQTGETVKFSFPTASNGLALISIENGVKVIDHYWVDTEATETSFSFKTTSEMSPNCYINIHYIQNYRRTTNDLPLRLYGIAQINVKEPSKQIHPVIEMKDEIETGKPFRIKISEQTGQPMNYTLAIVDEGLLALTNHATPNPYQYFYSTEALGVMTYDIFNRVIGALSQNIERVIGIGGGSLARKLSSQIADQRFEPVVKVKGPFSLQAGKSQTHKLLLPPYIGEVRTMIIARNQEAFGKAERRAKVKSPLMVMTTAPRKLVMKDQFILPVHIFRNQNRSGNVNIQISHSNNLSIKNNRKEVSFKAGEEEKMIYFKCATGKKTGKTAFTIKARDRQNSIKKTAQIEVYNPNPIEYNIDYIQLENNKTRTISVDPTGTPGTNEFTAEIATTPPFNYHKHISFLLNYPHNSIEQTVSGAFGLININKVIQPSEHLGQSISNKIENTLHKLKSFQTESGGFAYWPAKQNVNTWNTSYAGHFMLAAQSAGYQIDRNIFNKWVRYQKTMTRKWVDNGPTSRYNQAYRLYTLALSDKTNNGAMNRLRNTENLKPEVTWRLAATYAISGRINTAEKLIEELNVPKNTTKIPNTYSSDLREQAMILQTLSYLNRETEAMQIIMDMSEALTKEHWLSTQSRAWALFALNYYFRQREIARKINIKYSINNGKKQQITSNKHILNVDFPLQFSLTQNIKFINQSGGEAFFQLISQGKPSPQKSKPSASDINMDVSYLDFDKQPIKADKLNQTQDFIAKIQITHPGIRKHYENLALTFTAPGGWEIINTRFTEFKNPFNESSYKFRDFRDMRVKTYFNLDKNQTKTFYIKLNATYPGRFYMAPVAVEAMYDHTINARSAGRFIQVVSKE